MGSMRIASTPRLRIHGVTIDGAADMTSQQLADLIKKVVGPSNEAELININ